VVPNNGGGELFSWLPQRVLPEHRDLFITPHGLDLGAICAAGGVGHERIEGASRSTSAMERASAAGGLRVVEIATDPVQGLRRRAELQSAVDAALSSDG